MKKISGVLLCLGLSLLVFNLFGCNESEKPEQPPVENNPVSQQDVVTAPGYESEKFNLKFTPPEGYIMFSKAEIDAQSAQSLTTSYEMISEDSDGFPHVIVVYEKADVPSVTEYLNILKSGFPAEEYALSEISSKEIAGRTFECFTVTTANGIIETFYSEKAPEGFLCIAVITTIEDFGEDEALAAFSEY